MPRMFCHMASNGKVSLPIEYSCIHFLCFCNGANAVMIRRGRTNVETLVEASTAEAEAITAALAAAKVRQSMDQEVGNIDDGTNSATIKEKPSTIIHAAKPPTVPAENYSPQTGVRLYHKAVSSVTS